jgi:hypothetical protein
MKTLIMTVPHSGTNFLLKFLTAVLGLHGNSDAEKVAKESSVDFAHLHPNPARTVQPGIFDSVIITLRHPYKSVQTGKLQGANIGQMDRGWHLLIERQKEYKKVMFLVIDGPEEDRFVQLMAIAKHFGKEDKEEQVRAYANAWEPVNQSLTENDKQVMQFAVEAYKKWQH